MTEIDIVDRLRDMLPNSEFAPSENWLPYKAADEIERLRKYEALVHFIANDYHELSYEKVKWQRDDWKKRCEKLIAQDWKDEQ